MKVFSGKQIKYRAERGKMINDSQLASEVLKILKDKYGGIYDQQHFYHRGSGMWTKKQR